MYSQYQHIPCYKKYENDNIERNLHYFLFCKCTVLCYILEYVYIVLIVKIAIYLYCKVKVIVYAVSATKAI